MISVCNRNVSNWYSWMYLPPQKYYTLLLYTVLWTKSIHRLLVGGFVSSQGTSHDHGLCRGQPQRSLPQMCQWTMDSITNPRKKINTTINVPPPRDVPYPLSKPTAWRTISPELTHRHPSEVLNWTLKEKTLCIRVCMPQLIYQLGHRTLRPWVN